MAFDLLARRRELAGYATLLVRSSRRLGIPRAADAVLAAVNTLVRRKAPRVSVIIPSVGRDTLQEAIGSAAWADEVIVVFDAESVPADAPTDVAVFACGPSGHWGAEQRCLGVANATGTHLAFIDDDDVYTASAGDAVGRALTARPGRVHIFRMKRGSTSTAGMDVCTTEESVHRCSWSRTTVRQASGPTRRQGDFDFITSTLAKRRRPARFHEEVIAEIRPHEGSALVAS